MTQSTRPYADHMYSPERMDLAQVILQKELRKLFLGLDDAAWAALDKSIGEWATDPVKFHLEQDGPRDFWDSFAAVMESIKLKPSFTAWITAENVTWRKAVVPVKRIQMTSFLEQLHQVPDLEPDNTVTLEEVAKKLAAHAEATALQKRLIDQHSTDSAQDAYPIIARDIGNGMYAVMDGNRRSLRALLYDRGSLDAWIGSIAGDEPTNFWVPVNDLTQLVKVYAEAVDSRNDELQRSVACVLRARFNSSAVAEQAFKNRIANQSEIASRLYAMTKKQMA